MLDNKRWKWLQGELGERQIGFVRFVCVRLVPTSCFSFHEFTF